ncbi:hypothetical protein Acr_02g0014300 [Actinidia rufa]|uniref:Uncharacterized protein n=1 Tax=Actinidia rufa TaxID=165716 RepID=A0A7J0E9X0_9ERIC|nr:hypothetical protein Acr_02g0014300 [Actinidia rufa]
MISSKCLSPNPLDRGKTSPTFSMEPRQAISTELAQSQSVVSSSPLGETLQLSSELFYLLSSPWSDLYAGGILSSLAPAVYYRSSVQVALQVSKAQYRGDRAILIVGCSPQFFYHNSLASSVETTVLDLLCTCSRFRRLHGEIHDMAEQMRIMNENNGRLMQLLAASNPPPPTVPPVPDIERSRHSNRSGDRSQNISAKRVGRGRHRAPSSSLREKSSSESSKTPTRSRSGRSPHRGDHIRARDKSTSQKIRDLDARLDAINTGTNAPVTVDTLIRQTEPPFTGRVLRARISSKFKLPTQLGIYDGKTDPMDHLDSYKSLMSLQGCSDKSKADKYIAAEELAEAKGRDEEKMIIRGKSLIRGESTIEKKQGIKDITEILNALTRGVLALHLATPSLSYRHSTPPLPKYSRKLSTKNSSNDPEKSRLTPRKETGTNIANSTGTTDTTLRTVFN